MPTTPPPSAVETYDVRVAFDHAVTRAAQRGPDAGVRLADAVRALEAIGLADHGVRVFARTPQAVLFLDRALRTGLPPRSGAGHRAHNPLACDPYDPYDAGPLTLALASCDANGRTREAAVRRIVTRLAEPQVPPGLVVFLALRTADWVGPVRDRARGALAVLLHAAPGRYVPLVVPVAELLARRERGDFVRQQAVSALTAVHGAAVLDELTSAPDPRVRVFAVRTAVAAGRLPLQRLAALATDDPERRCRVPAAQAAAREAVWSERLDVLRRLTTTVDRDVRALALTGMVRAGHPEEAARHLADPSPLVRATARDAARRTGADAREWYLDAVAELVAQVPARGRPAGEDAGFAERGGREGADRLAEVPARGRPAGEDADRLAGVPARARPAAEDAPSSRASGIAAAGAVAGLAECGRREDADRLAELLAHPQHRVRAAALRGLRTLDAVPVGDVVPLLHDRYAAVVREAAAALATRSGQLPAGLAESLLADTSRVVVSRAGLRLLDERDPVRHLTVLLRAAAGPEPGVARSAADAAVRVIQQARPMTWDWRRGPYVPLDPTPEQAAEVLELAERAAARLGHGQRQVLHEVLAPMAPLTELLRVRHGVPSHARSPLLLVEATFRAQDAADTVTRIREVLRAVLPYAAGPAADWPADDAWPGLLPDWFTARCAPLADEAPAAPADKGTAARRLMRWRGLGHEKRAAEADAPWRLLDWIGLFDPDGGADSRSWRWWDAVTWREEGRVRVTVDGHPYGGGAALRWLIEAAGGHDVVLP
ncbi:hypothetical protein [Streptomyces sp. NPDC021020]|uniref:hypothetical protein n=1 Tax=Streptomyces sp. NPDC021020 TaxID=3365109 RepID=UPI0037B867AC